MLHGEYGSIIASIKFLKKQGYKIQLMAKNVAAYAQLHRRTKKRKRFVTWLQKVKKYDILYEQMYRSTGNEHSNHKKIKELLEVRMPGR